MTKVETLKKKEEKEVKRNRHTNKRSIFSY